MSKYYQSCKSRELNKRKRIDQSDKSEEPPEKIFNISSTGSTSDDTFSDDAVSHE